MYCFVSQTVLQPEVKSTMKTPDKKMYNHLFVKVGGEARLHFSIASIHRQEKNGYLLPHSLLCKLPLCHHSMRVGEDKGSPGCRICLAHITC